MAGVGLISRNCRVLRVESGDPARITALAPERFSGLSSTTTAGSSPTRVSAPGSSLSAAIRRRPGPPPEVATMSRISRANRDSLPTRTTVLFSANAVLQSRRALHVPDAPPQDSADTDQDAAAHIRRRHRQQQRLR